MNNFPFNVLVMTQSVIGKQEYTIERWLSRERNQNGYEVDTYYPPETRLASVQPVSSKEMKLSELQMNSIYIKIYDLDLIEILSRTQNPDRITYKGYYWQPISPKDAWNNWNKVYCVRLDEV